MGVYEELKEGSTVFKFYPVARLRLRVRVRVIIGVEMHVSSCSLPQPSDGRQTAFWC